ncbi:MAG: DNA adenine methylase [Flavobacteriales bacterium]|jgi:DNA adenine methylase
MAEALPYDFSEAPNATPAPFIKWVGGKRQLLSQLEPLVPKRYNRYFEPFVGGGALFFDQAPDEARLSDLNGRLIETYRAVRDDLPALVDRLEHHAERYSKEYYYECRTRFNQRRKTTALDRAALFIFLNKTGFNGLYRENQSGEFNVPFGHRKRVPALYDLDTLVATHRALQGVELQTASFTTVLDHAQEGDFVYFDPPYVPISTTSNFTSYNKAGFDETLQISLAQTFAKLANRGVTVLLSNSDCPFVRDLYAGWHMETVVASRNVACKASSRKSTNEVVVCSWPEGSSPLM